MIREREWRSVVVEQRGEIQELLVREREGCGLEERDRTTEGE